MPVWLRWIALTCLLLLFILVPFALWEEPLTDLSTQLLAPASSRAALAAIVVLLLSADVLLPVPSSFVSAGAVSLLGAFQGGVSVALGMTLAAWVGYGVGRWGGEPLARRVAGQAELARAARAMSRHAGWVLLVSRGVPVLAEATTLLAGATRVSKRRFALVTGLGNAGLALAYASIGALSLSGYLALLAPFTFGVVVPGLALLLLRAGLR